MTLDEWIAETEAERPDRALWPRRTPTAVLAGEPSAAVRTRVLRAQEAQYERAGALNGEMQRSFDAFAETTELDPGGWTGIVT